MENLKQQAKQLIDRINSRGGIVSKDERRVLVDLHNSLLDGHISYNVGCQTCVKKAFARLEDYFKANPIKEEKLKAKKGTEKDESQKELQTKEGGESDEPQKKTRSRRKSSSKSDKSAE